MRYCIIERSQPFFVCTLQGLLPRWVVVEVEYLLADRFVKCIVFPLILFLATARDEPTAMEEHYSPGSESFDSGVLVPFPSRYVRALEDFCLFHILWSTDFYAALVYVGSHRALETEWRPVSGSCHAPFFRYHWIQTTVSGYPSLESGVMRREDGMEYRV